MPHLSTVARIDTTARYHSPASPAGRLRKTPTIIPLPPTEVIPRLYVSDLAAAENAAVITQLGITHVVSAMPGNVSLPHTSPPLSVLQIPLVDSPFAELAESLPRATDFIAAALQDPRARVLVHCVQGISRSASIVAAYLVRANGWAPEDAVQYVKSRRPSADPNPGFVMQLREFADKLHSAAAGRR